MSVKNFLEERHLPQSSFVDGAFIKPHKGALSLEVTRKDTGHRITALQEACEQDVDRAIQCAAKTFEAWRKTPARERGRCLEAFAGLLLEHEEHIAHVITAENGKPLAEAHAEIRYGAELILFFAAEATRIYGQTLPPYDRQKRILTFQEPVGVVAAITPWNFPFSMLARKVGPALAAGCCVVAKPAPSTPLSALLMAQYACQAGLPAGAFNVVVLGAQNVSMFSQRVMDARTVRKVTFTGSTRVGMLLAAQGAHDLKRFSLELGGHAPAIIFEDADVDLAVREIMVAKFRASGQACIAPNRIFVQKNVYTRFIEKLEEAMLSLKVGSGFDKSVNQGPLIGVEALAKVERHIHDALSKGAHLRLGGKRCKEELGGCFFEPTLLEGVTTDMILMNEETFGPIVPVQSFSDDSDVLNLANDTFFGLAAYIFTPNIERAWRAMECLNVGMVACNTGSLSVPNAPFGGAKHSGVGREGGHWGVESFLETKSLVIGF